MKKWFAGLLVILILTLLGIYLLIPAKIAISRVTVANVTITGGFRSISQEVKWEKWWLDEKSNPHRKGEPFTYKGTSFRLTAVQHNIVGIEIIRDSIRLESLLHLISFSKDSTGVVWECALPAGISPVARISNYRKAVEISKTMQEVLANFRAFISDQRNVYGISIHLTSLRDTTMLSAIFASPVYPSTDVLYGYLETVEKSILKQKGKSAGYPLVNVSSLDSGSYETQVAIPTDRSLRNDGNIFYRRMVPGNFLSTEVTGGPWTIQEAMSELDNYLRDYNKSMMAKPFQQLITNRIMETDTSKWITRLYIPVAK